MVVGLDGFIGRGGFRMVRLFFFELKWEEGLASRGGCFRVTGIVVFCLVRFFI